MISMFHRQSFFGPPGDLDLVDIFYQRFLFFSGSAMPAGFKIGEHFFDDPGVDPVVGGDIPHGQSVLDDIHKRKIERIRRHDDKVGG